MKPEQRERLAAVFGEVIETQAFMFAEPAKTDELAPPGNGLLVARMKFSGPLSGRLTLSVPRRLAVELAANVLGIEADAVAETRAQDALGELLNVACGRFVTELAGEGPVFDLSVPKVAGAEAPAWGELSGQEGVMAFTVDDHPVLLTVEVAG
jgi:CheY-specific phosphatase CheX